MATDRRPYHRTADSIAREPWTNDQLATVVRLSALMHERWRTDRLTPEQASTIVLSLGELQSVTGTQRAHTALSRASHLPVSVVCTLDETRSYLTIHWPKWPEFQGLAPQNGVDSGANQSPSASSVHRHRQKEEKNPPTPRAKRARGEGKIACPERLPEEAVERIVAWTREHHPERVSELPVIWQRVRAWAESKNIMRTMRGWEATVRTFVIPKEAPNGANGAGSGAARPGGRRQTAFEAGQQLLAEIERRRGA